MISIESRGLFVNDRRIIASPGEPTEGLRLANNAVSIERADNGVTRIKLTLETDMDVLLG